MVGVIAKYKVFVFILASLCIADATLWYLVLQSQKVETGAELYFLDIGQGDSQLVILPAGGGQAGSIKVLIDGGPTDAVLANLSEIFSPIDRRIDVVVTTHPQLDHFAGLVDVLNTYDVGVVVGNGRKGEIEPYREFHAALINHKVPYVQLEEGDGIRIGDARFDILAPNKQEVLSGELNDTCIVALLTTPQFKALYTGDIGANIEERLVKDYNLDVDVLKVGHHGSRFSSSEAFLKELSPDIAVIEVGSKNTYGHPTKQALERLGEFTQRILRTDKDGLIKIEYASGGLAVYSVK